MAYQEVNKGKRLMKEIMPQKIGFWHLFTESAPKPTKQFHVNLGCQCKGCPRDIKKYLKKVEGVDDVAVDLEKEIVIVSGNFKSTEVIDCLWKRMKKRAEVLEDDDGYDGCHHGNEEEEEEEEEEE